LELVTAGEEEVQRLLEVKVKVPGREAHTAWARGTRR
jgi:hypothetical protein